MPSSEGWMSGLSRTPGKRVGVNSPPRVRIPPLPPGSLSRSLAHIRRPSGLPIFQKTDPHTMRTATALMLVGVSLAAPISASAEPGNSLSRARSGVIDGTTPGILILGERPAAAPQGAASAATAVKPAAAAQGADPATGSGAPAAVPSADRKAGAAPAAAVAAPSSNGPAAKSVAAPPSATTTTPEIPPAPASGSALGRLGALLGGSKSLSGEALNAAKSHESSSNGIGLPTAASQSK